MPLGKRGSSRPMPEPSPQLRALAATIRKFRRDRDLSQEALAAIAEINPKHLSELERANKDPGSTTLLRLVEGFDVSAAEFFAAYDRRRADE